MFSISNVKWRLNYGIQRKKMKQVHGITCLKVLKERGSDNKGKYGIVYFFMSFCFLLIILED